MRKLAESSKKCLQEIASWNRRKVLPVPSVERFQLEQDLVCFQFHHKENWARGLYTDYERHKDNAAMEQKIIIIIVIIKKTEGGKETYVMRMTLPTNSQRHSDV
jgi:hypothetical protein